MPLFIYTYIVCAFLASGTAWASAAAPDEDGAAIVSSTQRPSVPFLKLNPDVAYNIQEFLPQAANRTMASISSVWNEVARAQAAYDYVNAIIANRSIPANVRDVLSSAPSHARAFIQEFIIKQITMALEGGYHHPPCISVFTGCF